MMNLLWRRWLRAGLSSRKSPIRKSTLRIESLEDRTTPAGLIAVGSSPGSDSLVTVYDQATNQQKFTVAPFPGFTGGVNVAVGDVNGDGTVDIIAGAGFGGAPIIKVYSGVDGSFLKQFVIGDEWSRAGASVAAADYDQDGVADILVGTMRNGAPLVQAIRFSDGVVIKAVAPFAGATGVTVATGDVNSDGKADIIVGSGPGIASQVNIYDGSNTTLIRSHNPFESTFLGGVLVASGDMNGDGKADVIAAAGVTGGPRVTVFKGSDGTVISNFFAYDFSLRDGVRVTALDSNLNGSLEVVTNNGPNSAPDQKAFNATTLSQVTPSLPPGLPVGAVFDLIAPAVTLTTTATDPTATTPLNFTATFSEPVSGFSVTGIAVTNGTAAAVTKSDSKTYTFTVTPTQAGTVTVTISAGAAWDAAGNRSTVSTTISRNFDNTGPTVTVDSKTTNINTPTITGTVGESNATVQVTVNGQTYDAVVSGNTWTAQVTSPLPDNTYTVQATARDALGNSDTATATLVIDTTSPTAIVSSSIEDSTPSAPIPFHIAFNEDVTGFGQTGITVTNGGVSKFTAVDARNYDIEVMPNAQGDVTVSVAAGQATDAAGNGNAASNAFTINFSGTITTASFASQITGPTNADVIPVTLTFTDTVTNFTAADLVPTNGTVANFSGGGNTYTFHLLPQADGPVTVSIADGAATDSNGNPTRAATFTIVSDRTAPTATVSAANPTNADPIVFTVAFNEAVTGLDFSALDVSGGTLGSITPSDSKTYLVQVSPSAEGDVTLTVLSGQVQDLAGNATKQDFVGATVWDNTAPDVTVGTTAVSPTKNSPLHFSVDFTESVVGFDSSKVNVQNGTIANFTGSGGSYAFDVTPGTAGTVSVSVDAGAVTDAAGNGNTASNVVSIVFDNVAPDAQADPLTTNNSLPTITGTVDDPNATIEVTVNGQTIAADVTGNAWSAPLDTALDDGTYDIVVVATDALGNTATTTLTNGLVIDTAAPTIASITASPSSGNFKEGEAIPITVTFSEPVTVSGGSLTLTLDTGAVVTLAATGNAAVFTGTYTVQSGENSADLDSTAIGLTPGTTVTDAAGNSASLAISGSATLAANAAIVIDTDTPGIQVESDASEGAVTGSASDSGTGVQSVEVKIDDGAGQFWDPNTQTWTATDPGLVAANDTSLGGDWSSWSFDFAPPEGGDYFVTARVTDKAGNQTTVNVTVNVTVTVVGPV
jgi:hypothetical protein